VRFVDSSSAEFVAPGLTHKSFRLCLTLLLAVLACALAPATTWAVNIITTVAGGGTAGDGEAATSAILFQPQGLAGDSDGNLFIADTNGGRIRKIAAGTAIIETVAGNGTCSLAGDGEAATNASVCNPTAVAVDSGGNLYTVDSVVVRKVDAGTGIISTVAGNGSQGFSGDGGPAASASLGYARGVAVDGNGNLYIADENNSRVRKVAAGTGIITTVAGNGSLAYSGDGGPATSASVGVPYGVAVDGSGNLYIADTWNNVIRRVDVGTGVITTVAGGTAGSCGDGGAAISACLATPRGVTVDGDGNLYIADSDNYRVRKVAADTGIITTVAGNGSPGFTGDGGAATSASLSRPASVRVDGAGNVYIADELNNRVRRVAAGTGIITTIAGGSIGDGGLATSTSLGDVYDVAVDGSGNLYLADQNDNRVRKVAAGTGIITTVAGNGPLGGIFGGGGDGGVATNADLNLPLGVAADTGGNLYIADAGNSRIRKVAAGTGIITTVAGNGVQTFAGDGGPATGASLRFPYGVAVDIGDNLYIADSSDHRIRKVAAGSGIITTVAGNGTGGFSGDGGAATSAGLADPTGVAIGGNGDLFIVDLNRIRKVAAGTGIISTVAGNGTYGFSGDGGAATSASLSFPYRMAVDNTGNLYVADSGSHRIRKVAAGTGIITTVAGNGFVFSGDGGAATSAGLSFPFAVAVDGSGNLYIGERGSKRVRKVFDVLQPPDAPTGVSATAGNAKATVTFTAPVNNGGSAITGYTVTSNPAGGIDSNIGSTNTSHVVTGLANGTAYTFTAKATNAVGPGPASIASNSVTPKATTTTSLGASPVSSSYDGNTVTFTATVTGSLPTGTVNFTDSGASIGCDAVFLSGGSGNTRNAFCNTSNLAVGNHSITAAYAGNGNNAPSTSSAPLAYAVKTPTKPNPPVILAAVASSQTALVSFLPPEDDGGRAITGYLVTSIQGGGTDVNAGSLATTHQVNGLTNGVAYAFQVTATNELGPGTPSSQSNSVTPLAVTSTTLASSANPSLPGQSVTFTATVIGSALTGTVLFQDGATPLAGCSAVPLTGTQAQCVDTALPLGSHSVTALYSGDAVNAGSVSPLLTQVVSPPLLDVDASITATRYDALTDGLLVMRHLFGLTGTPLTNGALGATATRIDPTAIKAYLDAIRPQLDVDGNGSTDALTDGLLVLRYLFGLRGTALIAGAVDPLGSRTTSSAIETYLQTLLP